MKMIDIRQFWHLEKLATLTRLYLRLRLPLAGAIQAAKADLQMDSFPGATQQFLETTRVSGEQLGDITRAAWDYHRTISPNLTSVEYCIKFFP
jgi:hypothetical protein